MSLSDAADAFARAKEHVRHGNERPHLQNVRYFGGHVRVPHYCPNYREVHEKELELNDGVNYAADYELLSVWRLARRQGPSARQGEPGLQRPIADPGERRRSSGALSVLSEKR